MTNAPPQDNGSVRLTLDRHQRRREQGVPTLSVLVDSPEAATRSWQTWVGSRGWPPAQALWVHEQDIGQLSLPTRAAIYLYRPGPGHAASLAVFVERISRLLIAQGPDQTHAIIALAVGRADAEAYLRGESHGRAQAIFAEGVVDPPVTVDPAVAHAAVVLVSQGVRPETIERFRAAAMEREHSARPEAGSEAADRARSAAERFLFDLLGDLPETSGLFELNVRLGFCFGPMPAEVDLLAAGLRLAVEIDGFHHFREPDNYRRDRRKDALLQRQGYLVLRFLAEDVVVRLEDILEEIRAAVAFRRATR